MPKWLNRFVEFILLRKKFEIKTKLPKERVLKKIDGLVNERRGNYYGKVKGDGFFLGMRFLSHHRLSDSLPLVFANEKNSFAPVFNATVEERGEITYINGCFRPHLLVYVIYLPIHIFSVLSIVLVPFALIFYLGFKYPTKMFKEELDYLLTY